MVFGVSVTAFSDGNTHEYEDASLQQSMAGSYNIRYHQTNHYVPYNTVVGRYVYYPGDGDSGYGKTYYVTILQWGMFDYADANSYTWMNPKNNNNEIDGIKEQAVFRKIARLMVGAFLTFSLLLYLLGTKEFSVPIGMVLLSQRFSNCHVFLQENRKIQ